MASILTPIKQFLLENNEYARFTDNHCFLCRPESQHNWICDTCVNAHCENLALDRSVDEMLNALPEGVRFAHVNLCSIFNKLDHIQILLRNGIFDVLAVSESKLHNKISDSDIQVKGYTVLRRDRNRRGGGVLMYINDKWTVTNQYRDQSLEILSVEIQLGNSPIKFKVGVVYRPPNSNVAWQHIFIEKIENLSRTCTELPVIIMGDFNINQSRTEHFKNAMTERGFTQVINENTRETQFTASIIDHIYVKYPREVLNITRGVIPFGVSDHHMVYLIETGIEDEAQPERDYVKHRDEEILNESAIIRDLEQEFDDESWRSSTNINTIWTTFCSKLTEVVDRQRPIRYQQFCSDAGKWVNDDILKEMEKRDKLHQQALRSNVEFHWKLYGAAKNRVMAKINTAKSEFVNKALSKSYTDSKDAWILLERSLPTNSSSAQPTCIKINKDTFSDSKGIANAFNNFFGEKTCNPVENFDSSLPLMQNGSSRFLKFPNITKDFVENEINALPDSTCTGLDGISVKLLKTSLHVIAPILASLLNKSLECGEVPSELKTARVIPHFEGGDIDLINNYRPMSVLPIISNILDKHVFISLYEYLDDHNLLPIHQSGFRPKHTKETALHYLVDNWLSNMEGGKLTGALFPALCEPFETVHHQVLLQKLSSFGICQNTYKWFQSYLTGRTQYVSWKGVYSDGKIVSSGVPKGSKLGGLLFILFMNDFPKCLKHSKVTMFAGDIALSFSHESIYDIERRLQEDLSYSLIWMKDNRLPIKLENTKSLLIGTRGRLANNRQMQIRINGVVLENVNSINFLGIQLDGQLTWSAHIDSFLKKIVQELKVLEQLQNVLSKEAALKLYNTVIIPRITYCCTIWCSPRKKTLMKKLSRAQKKVVGIISNKRVSNISYRHFCDLKVMPVEKLLQFEKLKLLFQILYNKSPACKYLNDFQCEDQISTMGTRNSSKCKLHVPAAKTERYKQSFKISSASLWNSLPESVTECTSLLTFETECQRYLNDN